MTFDTFVLSDGNRHAYHALNFFVEQPDREFHTVWLHGPSGSGKTHLLQSVKAMISSRTPPQTVHYFEAHEFYRQYVRALRESRTESFRSTNRASDVLLLDGIQGLATKKETRDELLRTLIFLQEHRKKIVIASDASPGNLRQLLPAFASHLSIDMEVRIDPLDREGRVRLLELYRGRSLPPSILSHLAGIESLRTQDLLHCFQLVLESGQTTPGNVQAVVDRYRRERVTLEDIEQAVSRHYGVAVSDIHSRNRTRKLALARHTCFFLARKHMHMSFLEIGRHFGRRDHTTVMAGCAQIDKDPERLHVIQTIEASWSGATGSQDEKLPSIK